MLSRFTDVSQYALNIVTLIGLAVAIDYSLFIINRFRDELAAGKSRPDALAVTMATAGRAITFSGLAVAVGLSAMLFYQGTFLASLGAAGAIVVGVAVFYGLTFLPALLAVLGPAVNRLSIPIVSRRPQSGRGAWHRMATWVMRRPVIVLLPALGLLVLAGVPFLHLRLANAGIDQLPPRLESRQGFELVTSFPGQDQTVFSVVVNYASESPTTAPRVLDAADLTQRLAASLGYSPRYPATGRRARQLYGIYRLRDGVRILRRSAPNRRCGGRIVGYGPSVRCAQLAAGGARLRFWPFLVGSLPEGPRARWMPRPMRGGVRWCRSSTTRHAAERAGWGNNHGHCPASSGPQIGSCGPRRCAGCGRGLPLDSAGSDRGRAGRPPPHRPSWSRLLARARSLPLEAPPSPIEGLVNVLGIPLSGC